MEKVCKNCFADEEIIGFIIAQSNTIGKCDFCQSENEPLIDLEELLEFFRNLLDNFQINPKGKTVVDIIQQHWNVFKTPAIAEKILDRVVQSDNLKITNIGDLVDFSADIWETVNYWLELKERIKWKRRYITDINYLIEDLGWDTLLSNKTALDSNTPFYRARLHPAENHDPFKPHDMGCPEKEIATAGRANPAGIPSLYLCDNKETVLYEIRGAYLDEVTIGTFYLKQLPGQNIAVADFTETPTIFNQGKGDVSSKIKSKLLKDLISKDLSKPMRRYDSELDYIPTQFICEFIRMYTGANGIKFKSSLHSKGNNLVIFDQDIMECKEVEKVRIKEVIITA